MTNKIGGRNLRLVKKSFLRKRISHLLDLMENVEENFYKKVLKAIHAKKLNPIKEKRISSPSILLPGKEVPVEWWYFTGHLSSGKKEFGFESCFFKFHPQTFRIGFIPLSIIKKKPFLVVHNAITDKERKKFFFEQSTGLIDKDKISYSNLDLSIKDSQLKLDKNFYLKTKNMSLKLTPTKKVVKQYKTGYKLMYPNPKHRTYYVSFPRLKTTGKIKVNGKEYNVSGISWFDHQKANLPHKTHLLGWDWFSIMLDDKTELMFFTLRNKKGLVKDRMGGTFIKKNSEIISLSQKEVKINYSSTWKSKKTGLVYPSDWIIKIPKLKLNLKITPCVKNQEVDSILTLTKSYWEGACDVTGKKGNKKITGKAYIELVGYDNRWIAEIITKSMI